MKEFDNINDALFKIEQLEKELSETELKLCEFDILKNEYVRKYTTAERERIQLLNANVKLRIDLEDTTNRLNSVLNSNIWKKTEILRNVINKIRSNKINNKLKSNNSNVLNDANENKEYEHGDFISYEHNIDFSSMKTDIKPIALYLPQYHEIEENNLWWGKGFTEWTNVKKAEPRFENHNQPRIPDSKLGYYDLSKIDVLKKQVELAKQHGIYGFAFYHYWFSGKRLLEKPLDMLLNDKDIEFPFMVVWANENWTRTWDGMEKDVLIAQEYSESDPENFILDLKKYIDDERYIRVNGKPVIGFYAPHSVPNVKRVIKQWRKTAKECGIGEILIWTCMSDATVEQLGLEKYIDAQYEFPPRMKGDVNLYERPDEGIAFDYEQLVEKERHFNLKDYKVPVYRGSMLEWDNSARKKKNYHCWDKYSIDNFYIWNCINVAYTRQVFKEEERFIFINAWNEWGEGTYLEPDRKYGYSAINALSRAIYDLPFDGWPSKKFSEVGFWRNPNDEEIILTGGDVPVAVVDKWDYHLRSATKIAIQAHVFYPELIEEICDYLKHIPYGYDLYITTNEKYKYTYIDNYLKDNCSAENYYIDVVQNKGRDVMPFIMQLKNHINEYDYICHIHTKKSLHNDFGDIWRKYLYDNLLGTKEIVRQVFYLFESQQDIGIIFPENLYMLKNDLVWGSNKQLAEWLLNRIGIEDTNLLEDIIFPAGDMFWARTAAVKNIFEAELQDLDFPLENNQVDGTIMHAIERVWLYIAEKNGYRYQIIRNIQDDIELFPKS